VCRWEKTKSTLCESILLVLCVRGDILYSARESV
jgi:hypothetical protein